LILQAQEEGLDRETLIGVIEDVADAISRSEQGVLGGTDLGRALNWDQTAGSAVLRRFGCRGDRAMRRHALRDDQWERIKDLLPGRDGHVGVTAKDNRLFVEAVLFRYRAGLPWRDLPERFGDWKKVHTRFCRWAKAGVWARIFQHLADEADNEWAMIDSTIVRAHQHSAGAAKKTAVMKPSGAAGAA